ncbi:MAG: 2'-5' RNA ligase family protein, partial [Candidatus Micrarchaeaceae archaeon]
IARFKVELIGFGNLYGRLVYAKIASGSAELAGISSLINSAASTIGLRTETRTFLPHITVARLIKTSRECAENFVRENRGIMLGSFVCSKIYIMSSDNIGGRYIHNELHAKELD